ncbi:hypothetical protein ACHAXT_005524 [Thalassiosira profunda]
MPSKKKSGRKKKPTKGTEAGDKIHEATALAAGLASGQNVLPEAKELLSKLAPPNLLTPEEARAIVRQLAILAGTDVEQNDGDPYGDGDQNLAGIGDDHDPTDKKKALEGEPTREILRSLFREGGDVGIHLMRGGLSPFARMIRGADATVGEEGNGDETSPLLVTIALSKLKLQVSLMTGTNEADMDHAKVVETLLFYGARPDCKEMAGNTAAHYGAGSHASEETLVMTDHALEAAKSSSLFGKQVVLRNLSKAEYNGLTGTLRGFVAKTGRRQVVLSESKKKLALLPKNIFFAREGGEDLCIYDTSRNLLNDFSRCGGLSLHEVYMSTRTDVAEWLFERNVSLDICTRCQKAFYCTRDCQVKHWRSVHKTLCKALDENFSIKLDEPIEEDPRLVISGVKLCFEIPGGVEVDERFWIKVQCNSEAVPHLVYDKSRTCQFRIQPGTPGHRELLQKAREEKAFEGKKVYVKAAFDASGNCRVYPNLTSTTRKW